MKATALEERTILVNWIIRIWWKRPDLRLENRRVRRRIAEVWDVIDSRGEKLNVVAFMFVHPE